MILISNRINRSALLGLALAGTLLPLGAMATSSPSPSPSPSPAVCSVTSTGTTNTAGSSAKDRFSIAGSTITGKFIVSGNANCKLNVTITAWTAPNGTDGKPYNLQKVYSHNTGTYGVGTHTISTKLPNCFYQVDLIRGSNPTAADGSPVYAAGVLMGSLHAGTQVCTTPTPSPSPSHSPSPTPTPSRTPNPTPTPTPTATPEPKVLGTATKLPDTGGSLMGLVGLTGMIGTSAAYIRSRRNR